MIARMYVMESFQKILHHPSPINVLGIQQTSIWTF